MPWLWIKVLVGKYSSTNTMDKYMDSTFHEKYLINNRKSYLHIKIEKLVALFLLMK